MSYMDSTTALGLVKDLNDIYIPRSRYVEESVSSIVRADLDADRAVGREERPVFEALLSVDRPLLHALDVRRVVPLRGGLAVRDGSAAITSNLSEKVYQAPAWLVYTSQARAKCSRRRKQTTGCMWADAGQALAQRLQISQNSVTPKRSGTSCASGMSVKIFPKRTRGPNSGVITKPCRPYSPNPALIASVNTMLSK